MEPKLAPDFSLPDQSGEIVSLRDLLRKKCVVLFFYPKDNSPGCSAEVCAFRDSYEQFIHAGAEVVGVSTDSVESHAQFHQKNDLPFRLLSDKDGRLRRAYGVPSTLGLVPGRVTYIIDTEGIIQYSFNSQFEVGKHITESLRILAEIEKKSVGEA